LFSQYALEWLPIKLIPYLPYLPIRKFSQLRVCRKKLAAIADRMVCAKTDAHLKGLDGDKDLMSLLLKGNAKEQASARLSDTEVRSEISYVIYLNSVTWLRNPLTSSHRLSVQLLLPVVSLSFKASNRC
jgi:hypothetical protein